MAYTRTWTKNNPPGSQAANTADDELRNLREDVEQRMAALVTGWTTGGASDPVVPLDTLNRALVTRTAVQSITDSTPTAISFNIETFDVGGLHDNAVNPSRFTIPAAGDKGCYLLLAKAIFQAWTGSGSGLSYIDIEKNSAGVSGVGTELGRGSHIAFSVSDVREMHAWALVTTPAVGDHFEVFAYHEDGGSARNILAVGPLGTLVFAIIQIRGVA